MITLPIPKTVCLVERGIYSRRCIFFFSLIDGTAIQGEFIFEGKWNLYISHKKPFFVRFCLNPFPSFHCTWNIFNQIFCHCVKQVQSMLATNERAAADWSFLLSYIGNWQNANMTLMFCFNISEKLF